jgi:hypothetical protein
MEPRSRNRPLLRRAGIAAAVGVLLVPVAAGTATAKKRAPVVKSVSPLSTNIGQTLTIRGKHFKAGRNKNSVAFKRDGGKAVFVKADIGTKKMLKVVLSDKLEPALLVRNGAPSATQFRVRVLAKRFGKKFTGLSRSPVIGPKLPPAPPAPPAADPDGDCDGDNLLNGVDTDDDNDLLVDDLEKSLKLDGCKADTDGDEVEDGYEYQNARDLNDDEQQGPNTYVPYPGTRPYPNPLDPTDGNRDYDGDSLSLKEEYDLWRLTIRQGGPRDLRELSYTDGEQYSVSDRVAGTGRRNPTLAAAGYGKQTSFLSWANSAGYRNVGLSYVGDTLFDGQADEWFEPRTLFDIRDLDRSGSVAGFEPTYYDRNGNSWLDDSERDEDADGLTNQSEASGCLSRRGWWDKVYDKETPYYLDLAGTRLDDPDSDGDGIRDGADDQDHDDVPNLMECSRQDATHLAFDPKPAIADPPPGRPAEGFLNPFNPCLPHLKSRACNRHPSLDNPWAPFNSQDKYYYVYN